MKAVADTGPLLAAANRRDVAHRLAAPLIAGLGRDLLIPTTVLVETDYMLRSRIDTASARAFLTAVASGAHSVAFLTPGLLRRAVELDVRFSDLDLGLVDTSVMALAERHRLPILTFDFEDFRAATPRRGTWRLLIDEARYSKETGR